MRLFTTLIQKQSSFKTRHSLGLPPELTKGNDLRQPLPRPSVLIIEEDTKDTGGFYLYRYTAEGKSGGDTWHPNIEEAKDQAVAEYQDSIEEWKEVPDDIDEVIPYVLSQLKK